MKWRTILQILNRRPRERWPDGALHHGVRGLLVLVMAVAATVAFPVAPLPDFPVLERGMVPEEDIIAQVSFPVYRSEQELARARQDAEAAVKPIFVVDTTAVDSMVASIEAFFARVDSVAAGADADDIAPRIRDLLNAYNIPVATSDVEALVDPQQRSRLRRTVRNAIAQELPRGIVMSGDLEGIEGGEVRLVRPQQERTVSVDSIPTAQDFYRRSDAYVPPSAVRGYDQIQRLVLVRFLVPSIRPDREATDRAVAQARAAVNPTRSEVLEGERVVAARERVTDEDIERLRAYQQELERLGMGGPGVRGVRTAGAFLLNLLTLTLFGALFFFYRRDVYEDLRHVTLLAFLILAVTGIAGVIASYGASVALVPVAFPALVVAMLWDGRLALNLSLILAVLLAGQAPFLGITALLTLVLGGSVAALSVRVVRRRAQAWSFILIIAGAYVAAAVVLGLLRAWGVSEVLEAAGWGTLNAVASAFAAMGFLPVFEGYTRITTDQTLLELADSNRPLLRRLSMEAPGTYAHTINVANLAEAAADAVGANTLLTRVGVYYHDVGKIGRPHYFIENQPGHRNPHDKLKPATSAQVVRNHVLDGLKLAEDEKLPESVKAFILEHHGTQPISFFYDQAREADPDGHVNPRDFAYPGPKPQSKETAIVMLADSVESASRVLQDPTPETIRELVDRIIRVKLEADQLDEAPLTLRELALIREQFINVLTGMYHQRIDYPVSRGGTGGAGGPGGTSAPPDSRPDGGAPQEPQPSEAGAR